MSDYGERIADCAGVFFIAEGERWVNLGSVSKKAGIVIKKTFKTQEVYIFMYIFTVGNIITKIYNG